MNPYTHSIGGCHHRGGGRRGRRERWGGSERWGGPGPRGNRARRGDVRTALLVLLDEEPRNGFGLMQEIERRSDGAWRPSPGAVYPALQQLEDEGLVALGEHEGQRAYVITEAGRAQVAERDAAAPAPWDAVREDAGTGPRAVIGLARELAIATAQIVRGGGDAQVAQAQEVLRTARRSLYRILADDEDGPAATEA